MVRGSIASIFTSASDASHSQNNSTHLLFDQYTPANHLATRRKSSLFSFSSSSRTRESSSFETPGARNITQQFVPVSRPSRSSADIEKRLAFDVVNYREVLGLKVLLLSPWPTDDAPFVRQPVNVYSYHGSVDAEIHRVPGAEDHHFVLDINAPEAHDVSVSLPPSFRGKVCVVGHRERKIRTSKGFSKRVRTWHAQLVRYPTMVTTGIEDEDAVRINTKGCISIRLSGEDEDRRRKYIPRICFASFRKHFRRR